MSIEKKKALQDVSIPQGLVLKEPTRSEHNSINAAIGTAVSEDVQADIAAVAIMLSRER